MNHYTFNEWNIVVVRMIVDIERKEAEITEHLRLCNYCNLPSYAMCNEIKLKQIELTNLKSKIKEIK